MRKEAQDQEDIKLKKVQQIGKLKNTVDLITEDKKFLLTKAKDEVKKSKTLERKIEKLQAEIEILKQRLEEKEFEQN